MSPARIRKKLFAVLSDVELEDRGVLLKFAPSGGGPARIEDPVPLSAPGEMTTVYGVGRLIRLMRAARVRVPDDPYALALDRSRLLELLRRCVGAEVRLHVDRRLRRVLRLWTESGVQRIGDLIDWLETEDRLSIRRHGARDPLHVLKRDLIRYETNTEEEYVVVSIEAAPTIRSGGVFELAHP